MSHITNVRLRVKHLDDLETAATARGLELRRDQTRHRSYAGRSGVCLHAIVVPGDRDAFEIGVVAATDGGEGFDLVADLYNQERLRSLVGGEQFNGLRQEYAVAVASRKAAPLARKGFLLHRRTLPNGRIQLALRKR